MNDLIEALNIFRKYKNSDYPTHCEHAILMIADITEEVSDEDKNRLEELGFFWDNEHDCWMSYRFGSA